MESIFKELTHKIIGCAMEVHQVLGPGFQERIYQRAMVIEMNNAAIKMEEEVEIPIFYKGKKIGTRRMDFRVEEKILVEIKAKSELDNTLLAQAINYIEASKVEAGLLINFGAVSLQFERIYNKKNPGP